MRIISDIESKNETKNANNKEKQKVKTGFFDVFCNYFQIWQPSMPRLLCKENTFE